MDGDRKMLEMTPPTPDPEAPKRRTDETSFNTIPIDQCISRRVYILVSRNLRLGVYDGNEGFIGIREKFGGRFLFTEFHWDQGPPFGTVRGQVDTGIDVPPDIKLLANLEGNIDQVSKRRVAFDKPTSEGGRGWYFIDSGDSSSDIIPMTEANKPLFEFLDDIEKKFLKG